MNAAYDKAVLEMARAYAEYDHAYRMAALGHPIAMAPSAPAPASNPMHAQWEAAIAERTKRGMKRSAAIVDIGKSNPALWHAYSAR